jgi:hypothetical protein
MLTSWRGCMVAYVALTSAAIWAHHATAADFDVTKLIVLQGTVRKVEWINPHAWLHLDVMNADGKITAWRIEGASMNAYALRKFPKESVTVGIEISITVYPAKNEANMADGATITLKNGKRIFFGGSAPVDGLDKDGRPCIIGRHADCRKTATDN